VWRNTAEKADPIELPRLTIKLCSKQVLLIDKLKLSTANNKRVRSKDFTNRYPALSPRFWHGMRLSDYCRLLADNGFRVDISRLPLATGAGISATISSCFAGIQSAFFRKKIRQTELLAPPVFVLGHWRSGTTFLHELLCRDKSRGFPTTFQCFGSSHFLVSQAVLLPIIRLFFPRHRPMDNMSAGIDLPQEDEFALLSLGLPSVYLRSAFCNGRPQYQDVLAPQLMDEADYAALMDGLEYFYKALTYTLKKPLLLKSPTHTGRIRALAERFPGAKFIHIARDPYRIFESTFRLWNILDHTQGLQLPRYSDTYLKQLIFRNYRNMYREYLEARQTFPAHQLVEINYEHLVDEPLETIWKIYDQLDLEGFKQSETPFREFIEQRSKYQPNPVNLPAAMKTEIDEEWADYIRCFGYRQQAKPRSILSA